MLVVSGQESKQACLSACEQSSFLLMPQNTGSSQLVWHFREQQIAVSGAAFSGILCV